MIFIKQKIDFIDILKFALNHMKIVFSKFDLITNVI